MKKTNKMRFLAIVLAILMLLAMAAPMVVHATEYGNAWVYDEVGVVSDETEAYIANLNENVFTNYKEKPQLAFIIIDSLPYNMDSYKLDMFNEYGVGTKEENHGMLFVFAISDREYALEIGDGFEKGSTLRKDLETDFITEDMKTSLRNEDYDTVVMQVTQYLEKLMLDEENGVYVVKDAEAAAAAAKAEEDFRAFMLGALYVITGIAVLAGICIGIYHLTLFILRKKAIKDNINRYAKQIKMFGDAEKQDEVVRQMKNHCAKRDYRDINNYFGSWLLSSYRIHAMHRFSREGKDERYHLYCQRWDNVVSLTEFENCTLPTIEEIIGYVDEIEDEMIANAAKNRQIVDDFFARNKHRIENANVVDTVNSRFDVLRGCRARIVTNEELEESFNKFIKEECFDYEVKRFLRENPELTNDRDFSEYDFRRQLKKDAHYDSFRYSAYYNNMWMRNLLVLHIANRAQARRNSEKLAAERAAADAKRRQERARRQAAQQRSHNSSFGTGFRGGFSSGGGFRGGW